MTDEPAASVWIDIRGNIAPFEQALAKARQMADAFDAEVSRKLSGSSATEAGLAKIAAAVEQTNALLSKMAGVAATSSGGMTKLAAESEKASTSIDDVKASSTAATASIGRLGTQADTVTASIQRAVTANGQFAASNLRMADGTQARAEDIQAYGAALDDIRAKYNPLFRVTREYLTLKEELRIATKLGAISEGEASDALSRERTATLASIAVLKGHSGALNETGKAAGLSSVQIAELGHVVRATAGTMLAGGSAMQALSFEATRIGSILGQGGGVVPTLSVLGSVATSTFSKITSLVAGSTILRSLGVAAIAASLGFEAIRDRASEAEHRSIGFGETFHAIFQTIGNDLRGSAVGSIFDTIYTGAKYAFQKLGSAAVDIAELVINAFHAAGYDIVAGWQSFPAQLGLIFGEAANMAIEPINFLVKKSSDAVDAIIEAFNKIPGIDIAPINAPDELIKGFDTSKLKAQLTKAIEDRNAEVDRIMASHPLRTFASDVVDQIQTNHALEGLGDLSKISFGTATSSANGFSSAVGGIGKAANGVSVEFGGMSQQIINVSRAFQDAKLAQLGDLQQTITNLHSTQAQIKKIQDDLNAAPHAEIEQVFGKGFFGNANQARTAIERTATAVDKLFAAYDHGNGSAKSLNDGIDLLRQTLLQMGGDPVAINAFFDSIVSGEIKVRQLKSDVVGLSDSIRNIPNKTVTITVRTQQVGSGTQSQYSVPSETTGGSTTVGVTRYGGIPGQQSGPSITANTVPSTGYGSMGGYGDSSTGTVNVTRFATGGMIHPGDTQQVSFFKSPAETVGIFTPGQMQALADPQSGFTGRQPTANDNRAWTVWMNIEANTRKTAQLLDDIKTSGSFSGLGSSSSSGADTSSTSSVDPATAQFLSVLADVKSNFRAAGIVGGGNIGYGSTGLGATPEQIARAIISGGQSPVGYPSGGSSIGAAPTALRGGDPYNAMLNGISPTDPRYAQVYAQALAASNKAHGFDTGGIMGPGNGDTQKIEFFKSPEERVIIARPDQFTDARPQPKTPSDAGSAGRPIAFSQVNHWNGDKPPSRDSLAAVRRATALGFMDAQRSTRGR
ncbi:hypothetical protein [Mesorhizobium sp. ES1-3]|uniref:hypothetical protein n=1 Tax=Mesorhizobium sp. ES1-3 TaxID=2876628 RepID=UPI001CCCB87D|nr:hypothetical protein [Mesorhizobium sp. ES1-3]MBZ9673433.1 hypothetical protein [Mesorhizobium sp. ES1-3]